MRGKNEEIIVYDYCVRTFFVTSSTHACVDPWDEYTVSENSTTDELSTFFNFIKKDYGFEIYQLDKDGEEYSAVHKNKQICNRVFRVDFYDNYLRVSQSPYLIDGVENNCADLVMDIIIAFQRNNDLPQLSKTKNHSGC